MLLGADAGLRRGEIIALEQTDADYRRGQLSVARSDWCGVVGSPKGGGDGERVTETTLRGWMERAERAGGLPVTGHIHRLRHTFCSHLAMRGAPAKAIQELAGHADLSTTMRYMHLSPASLNQAIQLLEQRAVSPANTRGENGGRTPSSEANRKNHVLDRKRPHRDSNSGYRRERAVSWASRRWGRRARPFSTTTDRCARLRAAPLRTRSRAPSSADRGRESTSARPAHRPPTRTGHLRCR